ncbi:S-layer homology domain-containing protein [Paenibacillus physcomitrellae]|uniref:SLH domain-containing protein n=1 Tax=Paenibacillus physcomitrellae TaxID=1619311 RepID=A0ABQ1FKH3_9BACL|nr:S-layer homology domain-containing protein [Paenibacillus physcomitrellae]GGA19972.1 hypothetical protein GCM10010917_00730 [Paenibacillus physcomitrellae]
MRKSVRTFLLTLLLLSTAAMPAWAFSDTQSDVNADKIEALQKNHVLSGQPDGTFNPQGVMTYAAGVSAIVNGFQLTVPEGKIPAPVSSLSSKLKAEAWYSNAFTIAAANGLTIPKEVDPNAPMTREVLVNLLSQAINTTGNYPTILLYTHINDEESLNPAYASSVQHLLNIGFKLLDKDNNFLPKQTVTRSTAAGRLYDSLQYVKKMQEQEDGGLAPGMSHPLIPAVPVNDPLTDYSLSVSKINDQVNEVTITANAPTPGYSLSISSIVFKDGQALLYTTVGKPDPAMIVPQVITETSASAYIPADYKPVLANGGGESPAS